MTGKRRRLLMTLALLAAVALGMYAVTLIRFGQMINP